MLAFSVADIINIPFGYIMDILYRLTQNYGLAVILFAICVSLAMFPLNVKNRINSVKKARIEPLVKEIRNKFPNDVKSQNILMENLYQREKVSLSGGCLLSIVPILILLALYGVVSQPIVYMLHEGKETTAAIIEHVHKINPELIGEGNGFAQVVVSGYLGDFAQSIKESFPTINEATLNGINYDFLGLDLTRVPQLNFTKWEAYDWAHIGLFALPLMAVLTHIIPVAVPKIKNAILIHNVRKQGIGVVVSAAGKQKRFDFITPLMLFLFAFACFHVPAVLALYWLAKSCMDNILKIFIQKKIAKIPAMTTDIDTLIKASNIEMPDSDEPDPTVQTDGYVCKESNIQHHNETELHGYEYAQASENSDNGTNAYSYVVEEKESATKDITENITLIIEKEE